MSSNHSDQLARVSLDQDQVELTDDEIKDALPWFLWRCFDVPMPGDGFHPSYMMDTFPPGRARPSAARIYALMDKSYGDYTWVLKGNRIELALRE
jgi:hypothetical protein